MFYDRWITKLFEKIAPKPRGQLCNLCTDGKHDHLYIDGLCRDPFCWCTVKPHEIDPWRGQR